jgi:hypothetical protein
MAMQIAVNCKQHQAYQYGAFRNAFIHIESYSGKRRWSDDASLRASGVAAVVANGRGEWRCKSQSIASSIRPINTVLSAKLLYT